MHRLFTGCSPRGSLVEPELHRYRPGTVRTADFDFCLPPNLIAQQPVSRRDESRLLVLQRPDGRIDHRRFSEFPEYLRRGDVLVLNDTKVIRARLRAENERTGGQFEFLLLEENGVNDWWAMVRPGKRARVGTRLRLRLPGGGGSDMVAVVVALNSEGHRRLRFEGTSDVVRELEWLGEVPLPPYILREVGEGGAEDAARYQTIYARREGSVAAPTAGLHFTEEVLGRVRARGVEVGSLTLHVGPGTFAPVKVERLGDHVMHEEYFELPAETVRKIEGAKARGGRVVAVGSTTVRVLESVAGAAGGRLRAGRGRTGIFIYPPYRFCVVDSMLTNFHLPRSTLVMLVSAFASPGMEAGRSMVLSAYAEAVSRRYRFFSYGDAMLIV